MIDPITRQRLWHQALYLCILGVLIFWQMLPLSVGAGGWPGPDLMLALTFAWLLRRPEYVPALAIAAVFFTEDLLTLRPPGLWAAIVLAATEILRAREAGMRDLGFLLEWLLVSGVMAAMLVADRLILTALFVPQPPLGLALLEYLATVAAYPAVVGVSHLLLGLRRAAPGEVDAFGRRL